MKRALLLGGTGFVGCHMERILSQEYEVVSVGSMCDIRDRKQVDSLVDGCRPDVVINFAFITTVRETFSDPDRTHDIGFHGMLNVLRSLKQHGFGGRVLNIGSSEVYGFPEPNSLPITESMPLKPMSPYSVTKIAVEALCYQWAQSEGFDIVTARPFTHIGPGQSDRFALSNFSRQIAEMKLGRKEHVMRVGNLDSTRDLTDVRDVVNAYYALLKNGKSGEIYNVCSGTEIRIRDVLDMMIANSGINVMVEHDETLMRSSEQQRICGDCSKLHSATGWKPKIVLQQTLENMVADWKARLA